MNMWIRRVSIAVASTALAGGALLATGSSASAATASGPAEHTRPSVTAFTTDEGYGSGHHGEQDDGWNAPRDRYQTEDRQDRHLYAQDAHHRAEATTRYGVGLDRWYLDQVAWYQQQR
ncbi:hypothetical protein [Streptomyces hyaluromycini]|uniref:hypothetical protein n=1 Tax=Streptomyces hyaluromycini TaxID=1377993 RepID=UPI0011AE185A|nr:hypothetical protein [Streptomyces hyaluromycini]